MTRVGLLDLEQEARARVTPRAWDDHAGWPDAAHVLRRDVDAGIADVDHRLTPRDGRAVAKTARDLVTGGARPGVP